MAPLEKDEVLSAAAYYPFGLKMSGFSFQSGTEKRLGYNGKEWHQELGLGLYDYGFRWYDPAIARFPSVDPLAEDFTHNSVFAYAENRPIDGIDLEGLEWLDSDNLIRLSTATQLSIPSAAEAGEVGHRVDGINGKEYIFVGRNLYSGLELLTFDNRALSGPENYVESSAFSGVQILNTDGDVSRLSPMSLD